MLPNSPCSGVEPSEERQGIAILDISGIEWSFPCRANRFRDSFGDKVIHPGISALLNIEAPLLAIASLEIILRVERKPAVKPYNRRLDP